MNLYAKVMYICIRWWIIVVGYYEIFIMRKMCYFKIVWFEDVWFKDVLFDDVWLKDEYVLYKYVLFDDMWFKMWYLKIVAFESCRCIKSCCCIA